MKKQIALTALLSLLLIGCSSEKYSEADFLGRSSAQIVAQFGEFDCTGRSPDADGLYRSTSCGYTVREPRTGFLGTDPELLFFISFDENGVAFDCYEGYRPGG